MTSESPEKTEPWIASKKARHPYAYDWSGALMNYFGITGIPHSVLVDASGQIVWRGSPTKLTEAQVARVLESAWPADLRAALKAGKYKDALTAASSKGTAGTEYAERIRASVALQYEKLKQKFAEKDYFAFDAGAGYSAKAFAGLPEGEQLATLVQKLNGDEAAVAALAAQRRIRELLELVEELGKDKIRDELAAIAKAHKETAAGREADYLLGQL